MCDRVRGWGLAAEIGARGNRPGASCGVHRRAGSSRSRRSADEGGFTFVELIVGMMILVVLLSIGAFALRQFWLTHALRGGREEVVTQLRQLQQRSVSESHPLVYGARFKIGSPTFGLVKFNPHDTATTTDDTCVEMSTVTMGSNVQA